MRDIKYRLIRDNEIVGYEYHLIDLDINKGICVYHQGVYAYINNISESKYPITRGDEWFIFHDEKNQFTGLLDKQGKEIYEGDIVRYNGYYIGDFWTEKGQDKVEYDDGCYFGGSGELDSAAISNKNIEIIGNIYENKDLLIG